MKTLTNVLSHTFLKYVDNENSKKSNCVVLVYLLSAHTRLPQKTVCWYTHSSTHGLLIFVLGHRSAALA